MSKNIVMQYLTQEEVYEELYPKVYSTNSIISNVLANKFNLPLNSNLDNLFNVLGNFYNDAYENTDEPVKYRWQRYTNICTENVADAETIYMKTGNGLPPDDSLQKVYKFTSYSIDVRRKQFVLNSPKSYTPTTSGTSLKTGYVSARDSNVSIIYKPTSSNIITKYGKDVQLSNAQKITLNVNTIYEFIESTDRNAYPDDDWMDDDYYYYFIGEAPKHLGFCKIVLGTYIGSGSYGASAPNVLQFDFSPKFGIIIDSETLSRTTNQPMFSFLIKGVTNNVLGGITATFNKDAYNIVNFDSSISWYNTTNAAYQYNSNNITYHYIFWN